MDAPPDVIRSRANPLFRRLRALQARGPQASVALLEGPKLVAEALRAEVRIVEAAVSPRYRQRHGTSLLDDLAARGVPVRVIEARLLESLSEVETSQGLLALAEIPVSREEDLYRGQPLLVVAAGLQNPGNLGGLLRTAEAAGATGAVLTEGTADPFSWKALRGSMGSAFRLPLARLPLDGLADRLRKRGLRVLAADGSATLPYDAADYRGPVAVVFGTEGTGLPASIAAQADGRVAVPLRGRVESLNVGVAAGIILFEAARQRT